jgi:hypothetical protein
MAALDSHARASMSIPGPQTVPSMQMQPQMHHPHAHPHQHPHAAPRSIYSHPSSAPRQAPPQSTPAFSNRRVPAAPPPSEMRLEDGRVQPTSTRMPTRERTSTFPAFDTDWDVPAFQRKGQ